MKLAERPVRRSSSLPRDIHFGSIVSLARAVWPVCALAEPVLKLPGKVYSHAPLPPFPLASQRPTQANCLRKSAENRDSPFLHLPRFSIPLQLAHLLSPTVAAGPAARVVSGGVRVHRPASPWCDRKRPWLSSPTLPQILLPGTRLSRIRTRAGPLAPLFSASLFSLYSPRIPLVIATSDTTTTRSIVSSSRPAITSCTSKRVDQQHSHPRAWLPHRLLFGIFFDTAISPTQHRPSRVNLTYSSRSQLFGDPVLILAAIVIDCPAIASPASDFLNQDSPRVLA